MFIINNIEKIWGGICRTYVRCLLRFQCWHQPWDPQWWENFALVVMVSITKLCPTLVTRWIVACQAPLSTGVPGKESWNELPFPSSGDLSHPGTESKSPAIAGGFFTSWATKEAFRKPQFCLGSHSSTLWGRPVTVRRVLPPFWLPYQANQPHALSF